MHGSGVMERVGGRTAPDELACALDAVVEAAGRLRFATASEPAAGALEEAGPAVAGAGDGSLGRERGAGGHGARALPTPTRRRLLAELDRAISALGAVRGDLLVAERDSGAWAGAGDRSFESWRARTSRSGPRAAVTQVRQAEITAAMPLLRDAVLDGAVTGEHIAVLAKVAAGAAPRVRAAMAGPDAQGELVALARRVDAGTFAQAAARWAARLDPAGLERTHAQQRAARYLHVTDGLDGTRISGLLDRQAGLRLRLALESASPRPAADDDRSADQRRADALATLADRVLALPDTVPGAAVRPHVSFVMTEASWVALRRAQESRERGLGPARGDEVEPVTLEDGTPVPASEVARALCDCSLTRVVMSAEGVPLDLGRTQRLYSGAQRRAVIARDRHCGWPGCDAHARWCEIHHIRWWDRDTGPTSVENGVLLCSFHHHLVHRRDLVLERVPIEVESVSADPVEPAPGAGDVATVAYVVTARARSGSGAALRVGGG